MLPRLLATTLALVTQLVAAPASLREAYAQTFLVGVALDARTTSGKDTDSARLAALHFSSLTPENALKWASLNPAPARYDFRAADACVDFGERHAMAVIGHTLVWHSQTPRWVFEDEHGAPASRERLLDRMRAHIRAVVGRYRGRVKGWDVVNEAIADAGPTVLRDSPWSRIIGEDFVAEAFRTARAADPDAELYYNDYALCRPDKRERAVRLLRRLRETGVPVDGVGLQGHYGLGWPDLSEIERTVVEFSKLGLKVMITELDVDVLPSAGPQGVADIARREALDDRHNPYTAGLPEDLQTRLASRYADLFALFLRHREHITRVTFWGLHDGQSWLNDFPARGRTNHPLLFDRAHRPKPAFDAVLLAPSRATQ